MKIIKPGVDLSKEQWEGVCTKCRCEFGYTTEEGSGELLQDSTGVCLPVYCPHCNGLCYGSRK